MPKKTLILDSSTGELEASSLSADDISDSRYIHLQEVPTTLWTVNHKLNRVVNVTTYNEAGIAIHGAVEVQDNDNVFIHFNVAVKGTAICI